MRRCAWGWNAIMLSHIHVVVMRRNVSVSICSSCRWGITVGLDRMLASIHGSCHGGIAIWLLSIRPSIMRMWSSTGSSCCRSVIGRGCSSFHPSCVYGSRSRRWLSSIRSSTRTLILVDGWLTRTGIVRFSTAIHSSIIVFAVLVVRFKNLQHGLLVFVK